jgi:AAA15 family ATPase/GTPase
LRENGGILVVDELDHSLHPSLTQELVRLFQDPALNNELAQIIFTTHDTTLLDSSLDWPLMKDQVWFTEKSPEGSTQLIPLLDYRLTGRENIEKMYRHGRFGAIPIIDHTQLISDESLNFDSVKS